LPTEQEPSAMHMLPNLCVVRRTHQRWLHEMRQGRRNSKSLTSRRRYGQVVLKVMMCSLHKRY